MTMVEVKVSDLSGAALKYAYEMATGSNARPGVIQLISLSKRIVEQEFGDTVSVPAELVEGGL